MENLGGTKTGQWHDKSCISLFLQKVVDKDAGFLLVLKTGSVRQFPDPVDELDSVEDLHLLF